MGLSINELLTFKNFNTLMFIQNNDSFSFCYFGNNSIFNKDNVKRDINNR